MELQNKVREALKEINELILGKEEQVKEIMLAFLAGGHVLLEDIPGVGKTTLAVAFSKIMSLDFKRIQFTPDVLPSDLTGFSMYRKETEQFVYQPGSVFCNLLLADELNRTSPKTQSALLEAMEEKKCTVEGITRLLPTPFFVIATQNPAGSTGTQTLPEAQIDRFMITLSLGYPDFENELFMALSDERKELTACMEAVLNPDTIAGIQKELGQVYLKESVGRYALELITATREDSRISRGASPRGTLSLVRMAKAAAWLDGRSYVQPKDIERQFPYVAMHRIVLSMSAKMEQKGKEKILRDILKTVKQPPMGVESK